MPRTPKRELFQEIHVRREKEDGLDKSTSEELTDLLPRPVELKAIAPPFFLARLLITHTQQFRAARALGVSLVSHRAFVWPAGDSRAVRAVAGLWT